MPGSLIIQMTSVPFIQRLERAGVNLFHVSTRRFDAPAWPEFDPERSLASWVKTMTTVPVIAIGSVGLSTDLAQDIFDHQEPELPGRAEPGPGPTRPRSR